MTVAYSSPAERVEPEIEITRWSDLFATKGQRTKLSVASLLAELSVEPDTSVAGIARTPRSNRWMLQLAAGLLLVAGGAMLGRVSAGARSLPGNQAGQPSSLYPVAH